MKEKLENLPVLVFFLLGIALAAFKYTGILSDSRTKQDQIAQLGTQIQEKRSNLIKAENSKAEIPNIKMDIDNLSQSLSHATDLIPASITYREVLQNVSQEAKNSGIRVIETKPGDLQTKNYFDALPLNVEFEGSYSQLTYYMYLLSKSKIILEPVDMQLTLKDIADGHTNLKMNGTLLAYKYKETK